jgi:hypothetical protein
MFAEIPEHLPHGNVQFRLFISFLPQPNVTCVGANFQFHVYMHTLFAALHSVCALGTELHAETLRIIYLFRSKIKAILIFALFMI